METELKDLSTPAPPPPAPPAPSDKDDRPLLKPEPEAEASAITPESLAELEKRFAAYVRRDAYGSMGRGELPLWEKLLLGVAMATLVPVRVVAALAILVAYYLICRACTVLKAPNREEGEQEDYAHMGGWRRKVIVACGRVLARAMLFVMGFYWISETHRSASSGSEVPFVPLFSVLVRSCWCLIDKEYFIVSALRVVFGNGHCSFQPANCNEFRDSLSVLMNFWY